MKTKHFINLTNGLEILENTSIDVDKFNFMYIASTTLERNNYLKLLTDLDHNFLFNLAIGNEVIFYDFGTNRKNSKTCYLGINFIRYALTRFWLDTDNKELCFRNLRNSNKKIKEEIRFNEIYCNLFTINMDKDKVYLKTKLKKYKNKFLLTNKINLEFISNSTVNDGKYNYYKDIILKKIV